jgi:NitT/TauT family transport system permease protein
LYKEGLVVHIFSIAKTLFSCLLLLATLVGICWPIPLMKPVAEFVTKLDFTSLDYHSIINGA